MCQFSMSKDSTSIVGTDTRVSGLDTRVSSLDMRVSGVMLESGKTKTAKIVNF